MNPYITQALALEHQRDLEAQAGCCTPVAEHRRALGRAWRRTLPVRRHSPTPQVTACCA